MSSTHQTSEPMMILYDVLSQIPQPWVPMIWIVRFILNFKRIPYRTVWLNFEDVVPTLQSINAPPKSFRTDGQPVYALPCIVDPLQSRTSPAVISDPFRIAEYLETTYTRTRRVFPEGSRAMQALFDHYLKEVFVKPLLPIIVPLSHDRLPEQSRAHFRGSQSPVTSSASPISPNSPTGAQRDQAWAAVQVQFDIMANFLDKNGGEDGDGVVVMGSELSYADFAICSVLIWIERVSPHDGWMRVRHWNGDRWTRLRHRCQDYMDIF